MSRRLGEGIFVNFFPCLLTLAKCFPFPVADDILLASQNSMPNDGPFLCLPDLHEPQVATRADSKGGRARKISEVDAFIKDPELKQLDASGRMRRMYTCQICNYQSRIDNVKLHIKKKHFGMKTHS